jgi:outer membrane protein OmpA-like peptidoglycan-associated protein
MTACCARASTTLTPAVPRHRPSGESDRLGSPAYNHALSLARANTVRNYLAQAGAPAGNIQVQGRGESEPKVQCRQTGAPS